MFRRSIVLVFIMVGATAGLSGCYKSFQPHLSCMWAGIYDIENEKCIDGVLKEDYKDTEQD